MPNNQARMAIGVLVAVGLACQARAQPSLLACPEATYTVKTFETFPLPTGDNKNEYRVCFKLVGAVDGSPSTAEVWSIDDGGAGLSEKPKGNAFCHVGRSYHKSEFKLGAVPKSTHVYWNWIHLYSTSVSEDKQLARMSVLPASPRVVRGVVVDPCVAECKQTPAPPLQKRNEQRGCFWDCDNSGRWAENCPQLGLKDRETGQKITTEK